MKMKKLVGLISTGLFLYASSVFSQEILVLNSNYESDTIPLSPGYTTFISGWVNSGYGEIGIEIPIDGGTDYNGYNNYGQSAYMKAGGRISQTIAATVLKDETYTLTYDVGRPLDQTGHHFAARFKANGLVLAQTQTNTADLLAGTWSTQTLTFTATEDMPLDKSLVLEFYNLSSNTGHEVNIDNVSLEIAGTGVATPISESPEVIASVVIENTTLNVPEDFNDINLALRFLNNKVIEHNSLITIQVNNCSTTTYLQPITISHPQGEKIHIIGDVVTPENCPLRFTETNGIVAEDKVSLGLIDGFHLLGSNTAGTVGILTKNAGVIHVGQNLQVTDFATGFYAKEGGMIYADDTISNDHLEKGYSSVFGGYIKAAHAESYNNGSDGFHVANKGLLHAQNTNSYNNDGNGYIATYGGYQNVAFGDSRSNGDRGFLISRFGVMRAPSSESYNNRLWGFEATLSSFIYRIGSSSGGNRASCCYQDWSSHNSVYL